MSAPVPRIALAGLATSHPFTDARMLRGHAHLVVWEDDQQRLARFRTEHPDAEVAPDLAALLDTRPDGVVLTVPTPRVAETLAAVLDRDLPCLVNKPAAATAAQLAALVPVVSRAPHRVMSTSVLRFAPEFAQLAERITGHSIALAARSVEALAARVTVRHSVRPWAEGHNPWQDDPDAGGGTLVTMGIHGVELLVALFGPDVRLVGAARATRRYPSLRSEDTALLALQWGSGVVGSVEVLGVADDESYDVGVHTSAGEQTVTLGGGADAQAALGYPATVEAFLGMVHGEPSPVPWTETRAVLDVLTAARAATLTGRSGHRPDSTVSTVGLEEMEAQHEITGGA